MDFQNMTISEIKAWIDRTAHEKVVTELFQLEQDHRSGVKQIAKQIHRKVVQEKKRWQQWERIQQEERRLRQAGYTYIAGVDEVGRGPLAGPVVAAAVILPTDFELVGINDSKQLGKAQREEYAQQIRAQAVAYHIASVDAKEIDRINIYQATQQAMRHAIQQLSPRADYILIDAMDLSLTTPSESIIKGDAKSVSIAAASIIAKVSRDEWMTEMTNLYPEYGFERNAGYATQEHLHALKKYGPTPIHRRSFIRNQLQQTFT